MFTRSQRKAIYATLAGLALLGSAFGLLSGEQAAAVVTSGTAVFGLILAFRKVPKADE